MSLLLSHWYPGSGVVLDCLIPDLFTLKKSKVILSRSSAFGCKDFVDIFLFLRSTYRLGIFFLLFLKFQLPFGVCLIFHIPFVNALVDAGSKRTYKEK